MAAIAERLVLRMAAPAKRNHRAPRQPKCAPGRVLNLKLALNANGAVMLTSNLRWHSKGWYHAPVWLLDRRQKPIVCPTLLLLCRRLAFVHHLAVLDRRTAFVL